MAKPPQSLAFCIGRDLLPLLLCSTRWPRYHSSWGCSVNNQGRRNTCCTEVKYNPLEMRWKTEWSSPSSVAEEVGLCVISVGTTVWEQKKACVSEASFAIKSSILWIHLLLKHPIQPDGATAQQTLGLFFFSPSLYVYSTVSTSFLKFVFVLCPFACVSVSCLVPYFFSPSFSFSSALLAYCVLLASFQLCSSICPHSILQGSLCS